MVKYNNEEHGISAEIAICNVYGIPVVYEYRNRGNHKQINKVERAVLELKERNPNINIVEHVGINNGEQDFRLNSGESLSVKAFKNKMTMIAPQIIGQPSPGRFYDYFRERINLEENVWKGMTYEQQSAYFKEFTMNNIPYMLDEYWKCLGTCDYLILFNYVGNGNERTEYYLVDMDNQPDWERYEVTTTRSLEDWNESNTLKLNGVSIGEFQVHNHRRCFKFRFNVLGLEELGLINMNK